MLLTKMAKTVTNIVLLSPTDYVSNICQQHRHTSDTSTFILIFSFDFDFFGFVFDVFFFRLVELLLFELLNDIDDRRPDFERSADDRRFVLPIAVPLIFF